MPIRTGEYLNWKPDIQADINQLLFSERIGEGGTREVYAYRPNEKWVVKIECASTFHNCYEHSIWFAARGTIWEKWFAPVHFISPLGRALVMTRTREPKKSDPPFPKVIPNFFIDVLYRNWGILDGRWVCHDYGHSKLLEVGLKGAKLVKSDITY